MASPQRRSGSNPLPPPSNPTPKAASPATAARPATAPTPAPTSTARPTTAPKPTPVFLFDRSNYYWMLGGLALIILGFILIAGGKSADPTKFNYDEIYSFRRITLAPLLMLAGFGIEVYAIMKRPRAVAEAPREDRLA